MAARENSQFLPEGWIFTQRMTDLPAQSSMPVI